MASISKLPTGKYLANVRRKTLVGRNSKSKTFTTKAHAKAWTRKIESEIERSAYLNISEAASLRLSTILDRYSQEIAVSHKGRRQEQSRCRVVSSKLGKYSLAQLSPSLLSDYREGRLEQVGPKTVREELSLLQRVLNVCLKDWRITLPNNANPLDLVRKPKGDNAREAFN